METGAISDEQITASSDWNANHAAKQGRLFFQEDADKSGCWSALSNDVYQWLQIDLVQNMIVTRVATQGRNISSYYLQCVTKYKLQYGKDGVEFQYYKEQGQSVDKVKIK